MSTNALENQSTVTVETEYLENSADETVPGIKSGVRLDINAAKPEPRFCDGAQVHMSEKIGSTRMKGSYQISKSRFSGSKGYTEYQLLEPLTQSLHNKGAWYREKDLKQGS
ncbi:hypothetical protein HBI40_206620 [Parastagonospora nodorum]|nr:hypothetical protein HBI41_214510 [Parastagonospora nodorum]KAH6272240.1 hypothetical protein HBI40_206620 [Parastagonospora nodorum]